MKNESGRALLDQLLTEDLSGVTFVRDYLQLQFNPPPIINVYSTCRVHVGGSSVAFGEPDFANRVIGLIGARVTAVDLPSEQALVITLENGAAIEIPYGEGSYEGPEAFEFQGRGHHWGVWPG